MDIIIFVADDDIQVVEAMQFATQFVWVLMGLFTGDLRSYFGAKLRS